ncbi:hypothetical protein ILYODFUR_019186 [Ilyodon furcidens]|uniref:Uncharacterized protein n=1 Tax=Ilyodon furcidens TaxID=33524 RepID=A0ABV0U6Z0_9TELE
MFCSRVASYLSVYLPINSDLLLRGIKASPQPHTATTMFHCGDGVFRMVCSMECLTNGCFVDGFASGHSPELPWLSFLLLINSVSAEHFPCSDDGFNRAL